MFQLAKRGFDVWFTNNSGVQYSQEHKTLSIYDKEYWQIDWIKYGTIDFPAAVEEIRKRNGNKKVAVVGHSQGTSQTYAGMGLMPEWYDANVSIAALMGPCTSPNTFYLEPLYTKEVMDFLDENDIWVLSGPEWEIKKQIIMSSGPQSLKDALPGFEHL